MNMSNKISLNFIPISNQNFSFNIFRKLYFPNEKKEEYPNCYRYKLPNTISTQNGFIDYWVSFINKNNDFNFFRCPSKLNHLISENYLYQLLLLNCKNNLQESEYILSNSFYSRRILFVINKYKEGRQTIWLEPYYLKSFDLLGFLIDFKFILNDDISYSRTVLQLSLSLDSNGRSNKNYYVDKYERINIFRKQYEKKIFPLVDEDNSISLVDHLQEIDTNILKPKQYRFSSGRLSNSQYSGIKSFGPLKSINEDFKIYFLYLNKDKPFANDLFKALRGDTFSNSFPGMEKMFGFKFNSENVGGTAIQSYDINHLNKIIDLISIDAGKRKILPILLIPYKKGGNPKANELYHYAKYAFLSKKIPSQFISLTQLQIKDQLKWSVSNIGLQIFAKMGGKPWEVKPETNNCLIIGIGQAHKKIGNNISKYFAYSVLTESTGLYKELKILGTSNNISSYLENFKNSLQKIFDQYYDNYDYFVVHATFSIRRDELKAIQEVLEQINIRGKKKFVLIKFNDHNKFFGYSITSNSMVPYESSFLQLSDSEYIVWFEGLQFHNPNIFKRIERPLHIEFLYSNDDLSEKEKISLIQDSINISGVNWRGFNAKSLPISIYYAYLVADFYKEFQSLGLQDLDIENINPWFL